MDYSNVLFAKPISGSCLAGLFASGDYGVRIYSDQVAENPSTAIDKVADFFGEHPNISGTNIAGIQQLRELIYEGAAFNIEVVNAFSIVAPHFHWKEQKPVVYQFEALKTRYIIGHHHLDAAELYYPVSFVFNNGEILPYEWAGASIGIRHAEWEVAMDILHSIAKNKLIAGYPIGVSIDFRFKQSLFEKSRPTLEDPIDNPNDPFVNFSAIIPLEVTNPKQLIESGFEQVAWHPIADSSLGLETEELSLLNVLRKQLDSIENEANRMEFFEQLSMGFRK